MRYVKGPMFKPSNLQVFGGFYGDDDTMSEEEAADLVAEASEGQDEVDGTPVEEYIAYLTAAAPAISTILSGGGSALERYEMTKAKIENYKRLRKSTNVKFLKTIYTGQINKLEAKLKALQVEMDQEAGTDTLFTAGKVIIGVGGVLGLLLMVQMVRVLGSVKRAADRK